MRFDQVHGTAIELSSDRRTATRSTEHFCNGIAFSAGQVSVGSKICLELTRSTEWSGALRIGFTSHDPSKINPSQLPRYVCPDLTSRNGYWARPIHEEYADTGNRLTFYYNSAGQVHYFINNEHKGVLLSELPVLAPLWAMIDFYGNSTSATLVPADEAPVEIVARGPEALHAYHKACESGTQPVYRTRLMFVGQDRVGKTSLMKSLTGQSYNEAENATDGIDLSASCSFNLRDRQAWHLAIQSNRSPRNSVTSDITEDSITASSLAAVPPSPGTPARVPGTPGMQPGTAYQWPQKYQNYQHQGLQQSHSRQVSPVKSPGTMQIYEEEYHYALATNIVQELLHHQKLLDRAAVVKGAEATPSAPPDKHPAKVPKSATSDRRRSSTSDRVRKMAGSGDKRGRNTSSDTTAKRDDLNRKPSSLSISPRKSTSGTNSGVNATVNSSATTANPTSCDSSVNPATAVSSISEAPLTTSSADIRRENYVESHQPDSWALRSQELLQEVPDRVAELVEELWHKRRAAINISTDTHSSHDSDSPENGKRGQRARSKRPRSSKNIVLNIWDFSGQAAFYTTHQVFLSSRAVYVIVFNLCHDLYSGTVETTEAQSTEQENIITVEGSTDTTEDCLEPMTPLDYLDYWLNSIHAHAAENTAFIENGVHMNSAQPRRREERSEVLEDSTGGAGGHTSGAKDGIPSGQIDLSPPIFIVGTHRNRLHADKDVRQRMVEEKFALIRQFVQNKVYHHHIVPQYYAIENNMEAATNDQQLVELKRHIEEVASKEPYMGEQIPLSWLRFEQDLLQLVEDETCFSSIAQTREVAKEEGIMKESEFKTMLEFYHDLGVIVYYGGVATLDMLLRSTVILKPQWLIDTFQKILTATQPHPQSGLLCDLWQRFNKGGILEEKLIDHLWTEETNQKAVLLALMERLDLICEKKNRNANPRVVDRQGHSYYVPNRLRHCTSPKTLYLSSNSDVVFYLDFNGFLPDGLFHRLMTRSIRWSQECGGHEPELFYRKARLFLDSEHDFCLEMSTSWLSRVKVSVLRMEDLDESDEESSDSVEDRPMPPPKPAACARVRNFLESTLSDLRELWMKRISYQTLVQCYCDKPCYTHIQPRCTQPMCLHFLNLDECLSNKIVCCEHRRIKTGQYRRWFPMAPKIVKAGPILPDNVVQKVNEDMYGNIEAKGPEMPGWVKSAAKLLNGGSDGQDWTALAGKLGYKKNKTEKFGDDLNPGLALITDWIISSGNTSMSVDMLITYLETMLREDIVDIIQHGQASEISPPSVFISYQWDSQDEVNTLRNRLEVAGFPCWMDIGQMGGGDQLYTKVEEGIRNAKVVLACITPKYTVSHYCNRELNLADLLRKPIIPVMYEKVRWPPPGGMALVFSQLVYINMKGVGGHGGSGIHADLENKYQEILQRVVYNVKPEPHINLELTPITSESETSDNQSSLGVGQNGSPHTSQMPIVIPGYRSDSSSGGGRRPLTSGEMRTVIRLRNTAPNGHDGPEGTGPRGRGDAEGEGPVEQVHVTKCAVCTIM